MCVPFGYSALRILHSAFEMIYLDHHSTTPISAAALEAMNAAHAAGFGNPSSAHAAGRKARQLLDDAREQIAACVGAHADEILFTSGATESNNLAIFGFSGTAPGRILTSPIEHPCVVEPIKQLENQGWTVERLGVDGRGFAQIPKCVEPVRFATLMLANHETGAIQPVRRLVDALPGTAVHTDAAQAVGKIAVNFAELGVTTLSFSAHKFRGPKGVGVLVRKRGTTIVPRLFGGHQQQGTRPGTEAVPLAVGAAAALREACETMSARTERLENFRHTFLRMLLADAAPVVVNGPLPGEPDGLQSVLNVSFPGCRADVLLLALDLEGVACSTGSACSSGSLLVSPVLQAMGVPDDRLRSALRFSFGEPLTLPEVLSAGAKICGAARRLRGG